MSSDDSFRNPQYSGNRKPNNKSQVYSPSANYNYNGNQTQLGNHNSGHGSHSGHGNSNYSNQQQPRRKNTNYKSRDNHGMNDRLIKQNDIIIRLLKEIRDRLPANGTAPASEKHDSYKCRKYAGKQAAPKIEPAAQDNSDSEQVFTEQPDEEQKQTATDSSKEDVTPEEKPESVSAVPAESDDDVLDGAINGNTK
jgi:hypothetical protein